MEDLVGRRGYACRCRVFGRGERRCPDRVREEPPDLVDGPPGHPIRVPDGLCDKVPKPPFARVDREERLRGKPSPVKEYPPEYRLHLFRLVDGVDDPADADGPRADRRTGVALDAPGKVELRPPPCLERRGHSPGEIPGIAVRPGDVDPCGAVGRAGAGSSGAGGQLLLALLGSVRQTSQHHTTSCPATGGLYRAWSNRKTVPPVPVLRIKNPVVRPSPGERAGSPGGLHRFQYRFIAPPVCITSSGYDPVRIT